MRIDDNVLAQARTADVLAFLEKYNGFTFAHRNGEYRCKQHPSLAVKADRLSFFWHSKGIGGHGVIDYLVKVEGMPFREAVEVVTGTTPTAAPTPRSMEYPESQPSKALVLPEKTGIMFRLYDYLCVKRGIDDVIVNSLIQREMLYEDRRGNIVFVGLDEHKKPRFATLRGTHGDFRGDCAGSDKRYGFAVAACAPSDRLYVYESAIDLMSHGSMENVFKDDRGAWEQRHRLSLAGTTDTAMPFFLNQHKEVKELFFCLDNDKAGIEASYALAKKYVDKGYSIQIKPSVKKDYSEDLQSILKDIQVLKHTKNIHRGI